MGKAGEERVEPIVSIEINAEDAAAAIRTLGRTAR